MDTETAPALEGDTTISDLLAALHASDKQVRARAAAELAALGTEAVVPLIATLGDPRWVVRYRAAEALGQIRDPRVCPVLLLALGDPRDHVRYMAAKGLGIQRCPGAGAGLCRALEDENEYVRRIAAVSLAAVGDHGAVPVLMDRLAREPAPSVQDAILRARRSLDDEPRA